MDGIQKIMVALGFSDYAEEIFSYAAKLATRLDAELIVASIINARDVEAVGTISSMGYDVNGEKYVATIRKERETKLEQMVKASGFPADKIKSIFRIGDPADELLKVAVAENADMIVMGIKGRTNLEYMFVGSVAEKIFRRSPVPIVSYRDKKNADRLRRRIHLDK
ncbi:MAG: universal stress protein [Deltaproteobacteria bacterium]|nr:MAG: universal stress protein [Deltaproteobacteria bacterium]